MCMYAGGTEEKGKKLTANPLSNFFYFLMLICLVLLYQL